MIGGLYSIVKDENGLEMPRWAVITTEASELMRPVHDRMPVILEEKDEKTWIDEGVTMDEVARLLHPIDADYLRKNQISNLVNSPKKDSPEILKPVVQIEI